MHHSDDPKRTAFVFNCYLDDSGTEEQSKLVVIGGFLLSRETFLTFDAKWRKMLHEYRLDSLHMIDFVRPYGKHIGMPVEMKMSLFRDAVKIINSQKNYSVSACVGNDEFKAVFPSKRFYRQILGPYTMAFVAAAELNSKIAQDNNGPDRVAYLVDRGSPFSSQLDLGHRMILLREQGYGKNVRTGSLTFEDDAVNPALQGADLIAWVSRRHFSSDGLSGEFEPLKDVFKERFSAQGARIRPHFHHRVEKRILEKLLHQITTNTEGLMREAASLARKVGRIDGI